MADEGIDGIDALRRASVNDPTWFWDSVVRWLPIDFDEPYERVLDDSAGPAWSRWFVGGRLNLATNCVDRHPPGDTAVVWEGEDGDVVRWSYRELRAQVDALATLLAEQGLGAGDRVGLYLPMLPEAVAAVLAVAKLGSVFVPLFSGYGADAVAQRLRDANVTALVTADGYLRRGKFIDMLGTACEAIESVPSVATTVVVPRLGHVERIARVRGGIRWPLPGPTFETRSVESEHPLFIAYTSGTTGRPKGAVHVHGGWTVQLAQQCAFQLDCKNQDVVHWVSDMGWIMGPFQVTGVLAAGATLALYEGAPDFPAPDRLWEFVERQGVSILGISPTLVRALMVHGLAPVEAHDTSSLRILGSTGEPWSARAWHWYFEEIGEQRCPVINLSGGTEVGGALLSPFPVEPIAAESLGGPALGMAVDVFDDRGRPIRGEVGELVCTAPWPSMTRGLYGDRQRYLDTYWSRWPDVWMHGDWAITDDAGWFIHGRSDDTIKIAGKRLGPAEVESILCAHSSVTEAAAVGVPDPVKGEALWAFVVPSDNAKVDEALRAELAALVCDGLGAAFRPAAIRFVTALPKTRNAKVIRRAVRAIAIGGELGDLSALENPSALEAIREAR